VDCTATFQCVFLGQRAAFLLRERDRIFGQKFVEQVKAMGINKCFPHALAMAPRYPIAFV
jgi:hypothetical protein